jgi:phage shock protein PspC (stress-responsive transcriptional regulator)
MSTYNCHRKPKHETFTDDTHEEQQDTKIKRFKKLFRNKNRRVLGGVASRLAHYFNVDAIWIRLLFIILCFGLPGLAIIAYIVMWIVVPESSELEDDQKVKKCIVIRKEKSLIV